VTINFQKLAAQAATLHSPHKNPCHGVLGLGFDDLEVNQLAFSFPASGHSTERHPPLNRATSRNPHTDRIQIR